MRRLDCHVFEYVSVKTVVLAVVPGGTEWERSLLKVILPLLTRVESYTGLSAVGVSDNLRLGRALATLLLVVAHPTMPLVMRRFDIDWLKDLLQRQFIQESSRLEPFCILEYFRFRLAAVIADSAFDSMPRLHEVSQSNNVVRFCFFSGGSTLP